MGVLPTYEQVGLLAPTLLVLLRIVQGFAVAGELGGANAMIVEHAPHGRRAFYASFTLQGTQVGSVMGAAIFLGLSAAMPAEAFQTWGWRIPFLLSFIVVIAGYVIRRQVRETPVFQAAETHSESPKAPVVEVVRNNPGKLARAIFIVFAIVIGSATPVFATTYATQESYGIGISPTAYLWIPILTNVVGAVFTPIFGNLSDRVGRRPLLMAGSLTSGLLLAPYLWAVSQQNAVLIVVLALVLWGVLYQMWNSTYASFIQELFPARTRVTGFTISQNVGLALVAFLPSIFAAAAPPGANVPLIAGGITFALTIVAAIAAFSAKDTHRTRLDDLGRAEPVPDRTAS